MAKSIPQWSDITFSYHGLHSVQPSHVVGVVPIARQIILDLEDQDSKSASVLLVTIWELGEATGPLLIAPLSEIYGRAAVFNMANVLFILWTVVAASSQTSHSFILSRFMTGCAVASNVLNPAVIGDMLPPDQRGSAMATLMLAPLLGGAVGPAITGEIAQSVGWRNVLWLAAVMAGVCERRVARLKKENGDLALKAAVEEECEHTVIAIWTAVKRPAAVFGESFVLQMLSFHGAIMFTFFYILSTTLPEVLKNVYGFLPATIGFSFLFFSLGSVIGVFVCNMLIDRIYMYLCGKNGQRSNPEFRMPLTVISTFILPISVAVFGWVAENGWPVSLLFFLVVVQGYSLLTSMVPLMAYVVDAFGLLLRKCFNGSPHYKMFNKYIFTISRRSINR
ncbi:hypothetical protein DID88_000228 [Monilinia fructigena]|uniref:Major facilitator superfamily (MFS) profile domain-containing protein n=1 Tax=Monilinia fructigena TaxID=38457 RepID=A0A395IM63_9HELO|nr:hypothetical protein DID88_000228 [Monilinia fructigena]